MINHAISHSMKEKHIRRTQGRIMKTGNIVPLTIRPTLSFFPYPNSNSHPRLNFSWNQFWILPFILKPPITIVNFTLHFQFYIQTPKYNKTNVIVTTLTPDNHQSNQNSHRNSISHTLLYSINNSSCNSYIKPL